MGKWSQQQVSRVTRDAQRLALNAAAMRVEHFVADSLNLSTADRVTLLDPTGKALIVAELTSRRESLLFIDGSIPRYVLYSDAAGTDQICGFTEYLSQHVTDKRMVSRFEHYADVIKYLRKMKTGHDLEAVAAAILDELLSVGTATSGSGDQGVDAIGWSSLVNIDSACVDGFVKAVGDNREMKVFAVVSSKQFRYPDSGPPTTISPAFIRELIGGWLIQRSSHSAWQSSGLKLLSPIQLVLATTYRLSPDSRLLCDSLGVHVWSVPQLVYLICAVAPDSVFDSTSGHRFDGWGFRRWWQNYHDHRLAAQ